MKKLLLALAVLVTASAHATKARLVALGQDTDGSYYIMDTRNIFLNPAQLSTLKDHLNFEWGKQDRPGFATAIPENEGGFVMSLGAGKLAAQLGRVSTFDKLVREVNGEMSDVTDQVLGAGKSFAEGQNNIDVIYSGGGSDMHWGAGLGLTRSKTPAAADNQSSVQAYDFRGGIHSEKFEAFGSLLVGGESRTDEGTTNAKLNEDWGLHGGAGFQVAPDMRLYGNLGYDKYKASLGNGGTNYDGKRLSVKAGGAYLRSLEENARVFYAAELNYVDNGAGGEKGVPDEKFQVLDLPLSIGVEADANSWARVRASVRQSILIGSMKTTTGNTANDSHKWENAPNDTSVSFGLGASANKFNFDVALAQSLNADNAHVEGAMTYIF